MTYRVIWRRTMEALKEVLIAAVGDVDIYTLSGAVPETTADLLIETDFYSGLYWIDQACYIFVIDENEFSSSQLR